MSVPCRNVRLIADALAAGGLLTVVPDLHNGDSIPHDNFTNPAGPKVDITTWFGSHGDAQTL